MLVVAVIVLLNFFLVTFGFLNLSGQRQQYELKAEANALNLSKLLAQEITANIHQIDQALRSVVDEATRQLRSGKLDADAINTFIVRQAIRLNGLSDLHMTDAQGRLLYGTEPLPQPPIIVADREYFVWLSQHPETGLFVSKPLVSRIKGTTHVILVRRVHNPDASFAGVVTALVDLDKISERFSAVDVGKHGLIFMRDQELNLLARRTGLGDSNITAGRTSSSNAFKSQLQLNTATGVYRVISPGDQIPRTIAYQKTLSYPFYVLVGLAPEDYLHMWRDDVVKTIWITAAFFLFTLGLAWLLIRGWGRLLENEQKFRNLLSSSPYPMVVCNEQGLIVLANQQLDKLLGYEPGELSGQPLEVLLPERYRHDHVTLRKTYQQAPRARAMGNDQLLWAVSKQGHEIPVEISLSPIQTRQEVLVCAVLVDVTKRLAADKQIEFLAFHDALTGLPNRRLLQDRLQHALASSARSGRKGALYMLDLDQFKALNDTLGHDVGDLLLKEVGQRLLGCVREGDTVARLGGDEFVVLLEGLSEKSETAANQAEAIGEKMLTALSLPYSLNGHTCHSTPSIGVTLFDDHHDADEELLRQADLAMYAAKRNGRNALCFFDPKMQEAVSERVAMENELRAALQERQFALYYQPQVDSEGRLLGAEALVRWQHPQRGLVSPALFIPLAEETGLILALGQWILETACIQLVAWAEHPSTAHLTLSVNISAAQLHNADFVDQVLSVLSNTGANPHRLKLELTESLLVSDAETSIAKMTALKSHGVGFSLDDFGTGYSSLSYLKKLPLDQLKIDQGFVRDLLIDANDVAIVKMVIALAESLGLSVIAEGVESLDQRSLLIGHGCNAFQGYLFSKPLPLDQFEEQVRVSTLFS